MAKKQNLQKAITPADFTIKAENSAIITFNKQCKVYINIDMTDLSVGVQILDEVANKNYELTGTASEV